MRVHKFLSILLLLSVSFVVHAQDRNLATDSRVLTGTDWRLVSIGPSGAEMPVVTGTTVTLKFGEAGRASGSTGCNTYSGAYEVRGDNISFGRLVTTRRACVDQRANQQEQRFITALEMANRFRLSSNRLTILSDRGRTVLNFSGNSAEDGPQDDNRSDPVTALASYYRAINSKDYQRAYRFWESPTTSYEQFARGFTDTETVRFLIEPPRIDGAAGSAYAEIPTIVIADTGRRNERVFAGCYVLRRSNVSDRGWLIYRADLSMLPANTRVSRVLSQGCRNSR